MSTSYNNARRIMSEWRDAVVTRRTGDCTCSLLLAAQIAVLLPVVAPAQTRESGPWWPNTEWGPDDQAGASNRITPAKILAAMSLVRTGEVYEIGQVYENGMRLVGGRTYGLKLIPSGSAGGDNRMVSNDEFVAAEIGQVGTQFDGLGHFGREMSFADGSTDRVFHKRLHHR